MIRPTEFSYKMFRVTILFSVVLSFLYVALITSSVANSVDFEVKYDKLNLFDDEPLAHPMQVEKVNRYEANWKSIDSRPIPEWYEDAKIGIFIHWGVYSVPSFGSEWFWLYLVNGEDAFVKFMKQNYPPNFTYQDFGPQLTGEFFDASQWAKIFEGSGAKYIIFTSKHHEGFTMWPSSYAFGWNSKDVGLKRDVVGELAAAIRGETNLHFGLYYSLMEWYNPLYLADKANDLTTQVFVDQKVMPELKELVNKYKPDIVWTDGDWDRPASYWKSTEFLAWLYNSSPVKEKVVVNDRWGSNMACHHGGYLTCKDRYNPGKIQSRKWENVLTIDKYSWGARREAKLADFLTIEEIIVIIAQTVSCGGNVVLNVGPSREGTINAIYQDRLAALGKWLKINGQAIYETRPWNHCQKDSNTEHVWYTSKTEGAEINVFALVLNWPRDGFVDLGCLLEVNVQSVTMLGVGGKLKFQPVDLNKGVRVFLPDKASTTNDWAWTLKVSYQP
ncbi:hypothetical protein LSTR_LSTR005727 [Laodelphax striatellus]|uniref:Putative alpha-L-fucosidase n=1 Tax=Laodelphax striatellus TaxID=195883 RepID=A0A482XHL9_LAOST|nr:hypothetical protein LSTR_LSTR005727 [Laodelphax striatellus]